MEYATVRDRERAEKAREWELTRVGSPVSDHDERYSDCEGISPLPVGTIDRIHVSRARECVNERKIHEDIFDDARGISFGEPSS